MNQPTSNNLKIIQVSWKKRPLFRRREGGGEGFFRTGAEAADMLYAEAERHGAHQDIFLDTVRDVLDSVAPVIDRWPQYAWVAKQLLEAERVSVDGWWLMGGCWDGRTHGKKARCVFFLFLCLYFWKILEKTRKCVT